MRLRVAVQMDPPGKINVEGDSTFAIMLAGQARGHELLYHDVGSLSLWNDRVTAEARPIQVQSETPHVRLGETRRIDLGRDVDVVLMRQDPPFDLGYITATHLLERIQSETLVVNDPAEVRNAPEKIWVLEFARFMPPTLVTRSESLVRDFLAEHGDIVLKPLHGHGGRAVFRIRGEGENLTSLLEMFNATYGTPHMVQAFLPEVRDGDKRIVLVDGEVAGAVNRIPGEGEIRSNLAAGGRAAASALTPREEEICAALGPELKARGLVFVGIDVIGGEWLTEINVTSPTGIVAIDRFNGSDTGALIWEKIEERLR